jgi:hypothetical protein
VAQHGMRAAIEQGGQQDGLGFEGGEVGGAGGAAEASRAKTRPESCGRPVAAARHPPLPALCPEALQTELRERCMWRHTGAAAFEQRSSHAGVGHWKSSCLFWLRLGADWCSAVKAAAAPHLKRTRQSMPSTRRPSR